MNETEKEVEKEPTIVQPFNDATDHYQKIMGMPNKSADLNILPKWIKIFFYFVLACGLCAVVFVIISLFHEFFN